MENWERDILKNLHDHYKELEWTNLPLNLSEFWARIPGIYVEERGLYISLVYEEHELVLGFGEYGGVGAEFDGQLYWQTYTHKEESTNWEMAGYVWNGSPQYVWSNVFKQLSKQIELMGAK